MNYQVADAFNDLSGHSWLLDALMRFAATYLIFVAGAIFAGLMLHTALVRHAWWPVAQVGAVLLLAFAFGLFASHVYGEQRPFTAHADIHRLIPHAAGQSFPSDHATASFAIALGVLMFVSAFWGKLLLSLAAVIGFARIFTGVHYPGDILGSLAVVVIAVALVELFSRLRRSPVSQSG